VGAILNAQQTTSDAGPPVLSAVVLFWNGAPFVSACLTSLMTQTLRNVEIVLVDNASTDDTLALLERQAPHLPLIRNERNLGFAGGMNAGIRAAHAPLLVLVNQDVVLDPRCLEQIALAFAEDQRVGAVGAKLYYPDRMTLQHAGGYLEPPLALGHHYGYGEIDVGQYDTPRDVEYVTGAVLGLRRAAVEEVGALDEQFWPGYFEEVDLCHRLRAAGWRVRYQPTAVAVHWESTSLGRNSDRYYLAYHRGRLRYLIKHLEGEAWRAFAAAEAARYPTLASRREQAALSAVYRELASEIERRRPEVLPYYRRLLRLEPPLAPQRLPGFRRYFHPARARDLDRTLDPLRRSWRVLGPPILPPERRPLPLLRGVLRTLSWLVIRWSFLPVLEQQDNYNRALIETFQAWRDEYEHLLNRLINLLDSLEVAFATLDDRDERLEGQLGQLLTLRSLLGHLEVRAGEDEEIVAAIDRDVVRLRREVALLQARIARLERATPGVDGRVPAEEA
jgi:GT2 family glycosyltransferase